MFKIGDKVVYITGNNMTKNSIHVVSDTRTGYCGCQTIAINGNKLVAVNAICKCSSCWNLDSVRYLNGTAWQATSFRKLDDTFATETLERISYEVEQEELVCL